MARDLVARLPERTIYVLLGFPLAIVGFVVTVAGLALGFGLLITVVGLPVLVVALLTIRGMATVERAMAARFAGLEPPPVTVYRRADDSGWLRDMLVPLRDRQSWLDAMHAIVVFPVAVGAFVVSVTWWSFALAATTWTAWGWLVPDGPDSEDLPELLGLGSSYGVRAVFYTVTGLVAVVSLPWVITATARARSFVTDVLLIGPSRHRHQVDTLVAGRDAARAVEQTALRRLERDIHDGPQQRLVRLSMDLGRAQAKIGSADAELEHAIEDAKRQTTEALDELRSLSRGIAPPILIDRGLGNALEELAVRSAIPTGCSVALTPERVPSHIESAAYFVASEALANAAKHSGASSAMILAEQTDDELRVIVTDDGKGGAHASKGHGLAGLEQRVRAVDGHLTIDSPIGGPTTITAEIPCGS